MKFSFKPTMLVTSLAFALTATVSPLAQAFDGWHLEATTSIPGKNSSWDYISLDEANNRLFIGRRAMGLQAFDLATGKVDDMPDSRIAMAVAAATAPTPTLPLDHSHSDRPATAAVSAMDRMWLTISKALTSRIWP